MTPRIRSLMSAAAVAAALLMVAGPGAAQQAAKSDKQDDLDRYMCKDVVRMSGDDRTIALSALHGYTLGRKARPIRSCRAAKISDAFVEHCLSNPNDKALRRSPSSRSNRARRVTRAPMSGARQRLINQ